MTIDYAARVSRVQAKLEAEGLDAIVLATMDTPKADGSNKNVDYLSGFSGSTGVVAVSQTNAVLVVDGRYTERAKVSSPQITHATADNKNRGVVDFTNYVRPALEALKIGSGSQVAFESHRLSVWMLDAWRTIEGVTWVPTVHIVESLRYFKDKDEIALIRDACAKTCDVWVERAPHIVAGKTERQVAIEFDMALREKGAVDNSFGTIVASGPNSASPHHETSGRIIQAGEPVTVDFGGIFERGYCSDLTRTLFVAGKDPDQKLVEIYKTVLDANMSARNALKIGMLWKEYDKVARDYISLRGYGEYFGHGLGHSLGLEAHDPYNYAEQKFEEGMVVTDEPGIYVPNLGGVRIEDDLVLTESGVENLTEPAPYLAL
mgnify:CR=1 FL=1